MSDQEEIETKRFARRSIEVKGLVHYDEGLPENAIHALSEYGVHWNLHGNVRLETTQLTRKTIYVAGDELPGGLTSTEKQWVLDLAEKNGLDVGVVEEEVEVLPDVPYIKSPILIHYPRKDEWVKNFEIEVHSDKFYVPTATIDLSRNGHTLYIVIEGDCKNAVSNPVVDRWVQENIKLIRDALAHAGFTEKSIEIDCEVIMGAEREAKCDPEFMRNLIQTDEQEEE